MIDNLQFICVMLCVLSKSFVFFCWLKNIVLNEIYLGGWGDFFLALFLRFFFSGVRWKKGWTADSCRFLEDITVYEGTTRRSRFFSFRFLWCGRSLNVDRLRKVAILLNGWHLRNMLNYLWYMQLYIVKIVFSVRIFFCKWDYLTKV